MLFPDSPRSRTSSFSTLSTSPPKLDPSTLAYLDAFLAAKADEEGRFNQLAAGRAAAAIAGIDVDGEEETPMMTVDEYRRAFGEDWQLSQFWYTTDFANNFANYLHSLCSEETTIAFLCCPTGFVAFQHKKPLEGARLLEIDQRFSVLSTKAYVPYDLDKPTSVPQHLKGTIDIAVVDPPFLNEDTNMKILTTLKLLLHPIKGRLILITSTSIEDALHRIYDSEIGILRKTALKVEHKQLANDFACWGTWEGAEGFGSGEPEEVHVSK